MDIFTEKLEAFFAEFGTGRKMVLSTCESGKPSSRTMSVVRIGGEFFFQTDVTLRKYRQLAACPNAALCIDNIQIEGSCAELGRPKDSAEFCETSSYKNKAFTVSVADVPNMETADLFGIITRDKMPDKFKRSGCCTVCDLICLDKAERHINRP